MLYKFYIIILQVVHCSVHGLSSLPSSELHPLSVHTLRHSSDDDSFDDPGEGIANMNLGAPSLSVSSPSSSSSSNGHCLTDNFHYPHHCKVPYCAFIVAWRERDSETIVFNLTAKVTGSRMVWAAIGFSEDAKMVKKKRRERVAPYS